MYSDFNGFGHKKGESFNRKYLQMGNGCEGKDIG